jgi:hypothetical protein
LRSRPGLLCGPSGFIDVPLGYRHGRDYAVQLAHHRRRSVQKWLSRTPSSQMLQRLASKFRGIFVTAILLNFAQLRSGC